MSSLIQNSKKNNTWLDIVRSLSTSMQSKLRLFVFERVIDIQNPQNSPIFVWVLQFTYLKKSTAHLLCVVGVYPSTFIYRKISIIVQS